MKPFIRIMAYLMALAVVPNVTAILAQVPAPLLKWQYGGCFSSWCETGWYSSVAVADLDGDGNMEVIGSAYSVVALDGKSGALKWRASSGHDRSEAGANNVGRTWPGVVLADVNGDNAPEIVTAHGGGYVAVYDRNSWGWGRWGWDSASLSFRNSTDPARPMRRPKGMISA